MLQRSSSCVDKIQASGFNYWSNLPDDLRVDILLRLPDKQLIRLKVVSKSWNFLISAQCAPKISSTVFCGLIFIHEFPLVSRFALRFSIYSEYRKCPPELFGGLPDYLDSFLPFRHEPNNFQDCCNGLLLLARCTSPSIPTQYYVCNPTTYECISIAPNPNHMKEKNIYVASLLFDANKAYDSPNSYMVAVLRESTPRHSRIKFDLFTSFLRNWSSHIISLDPVLDGFKLVNRTIYVNGILYMLSMAKYLISIRFTEENINITMTSSHIIELPGKDEFDCCGSFGSSQGNLVYSNSDYSKIQVWMFRENNAQWVLQHTIKVDQLVASSITLISLPVRRAVAQLSLPARSGSGPIKVYGFHSYTEELFLATQTMLIKYNPTTKKFAQQALLGPSRKIVGEEYRVFPFTRCPVILNSFIKSNTK